MPPLSRANLKVTRNTNHRGFIELSSLSLFDRPKDGFLGEKMYWESIVLDIAFQRKAPLGSEASRSRLP